MLAAYISAMLSAPSSRLNAAKAHFCQQLLDTHGCNDSTVDVAQNLPETFSSSSFLVVSHAKQHARRLYFREGTIPPPLLDCSGALQNGRPACISTGTDKQSLRSQYVTTRI